MRDMTIVGYRYGDQTLCPPCIQELFMPFDLSPDLSRSAEQLLDEAASRRGIIRLDPDSFSSYEFPQPLTAHEVNDADVCELCGQALHPTASGP